MAGKIETLVKHASHSVSNKKGSGSKTWFLSRIKNMNVDPIGYNISVVTFIGGMFFFKYDAKHKATLPYWDKFPIVIPLSIYDDGFLGLNLHYLPPILRAKLLDVLVSNLQKAKGNRGVFLKISYPLLQTVAKNKNFEVCIKRYLSTHIKSRFVRVEEESWEEAAFLPLQQFQKETDKEVWKRAR